MGGEGGFLEKLKAMFGGGAPAPAPTPEPRVPWETQMGPSAMPSPMPTPSPEATPMPQGQDAIEMQIQKLLRQREIAKKLIPQETWNR